MTETEHLLVCLMEEAGEIIQAASKVLRFGLADFNPNTGNMNVTDLQREISDLITVGGMLSRKHVLPYWGSIDPSIKEEKVLEYIKYAKQKGTIND